MKRMTAHLASGESRYANAFTIQRQEILSADEVARVLSWAVTGVGWLLIALFVISVINAVLGLFTWTERLAERMYSLFIGTVSGIWTAIVDYIPDLLVIIVVIALMRLVLHVLKMVFDGIGTRRINIHGFYPEWAHTSYNLSRLLIYALTLVIIFPYLPGSSSPAFQGLSIFLGVLVSLGSTSAVANVVAGVVLTYTRAFRNGDRVKIDDTNGIVVERSMFVTRLETMKNEIVSIPNASVLGAHVVNYSAIAKSRGLILHTAVTIGYDVPWPKVHELMIAAAERTEGIEEEPAPFVLQTALGDFSVSYELNAATKSAHQMQRIYSALHANILDAFNEAGVEILSPVFEARRDGTTPAIAAVEPPPPDESPSGNDPKPVGG
jgi:small-conductance mechanosensitive channel